MFLANGVSYYFIFTAKAVLLCLFIMTILFPFFERDRDWWCLILLGTLLDNNEFSIFLILWMWTTVCTNYLRVIHKNEKQGQQGFGRSVAFGSNHTCFFFSTCSL